MGQPWAPKCPWAQWCLHGLLMGNSRVPVLCVFVPLPGSLFLTSTQSADLAVNDRSSYFLVAAVADDLWAAMICLWRLAGAAAVFARCTQPERCRRTKAKSALEIGHPNLVPFDVPGWGRKIADPGDGMSHQLTDDDS